MPQVIPVVVYYAVEYFAANAVWAYVAAAAASYGVSKHQEAEARKRANRAYNASLEDRLVMTVNTQGARSRVYGRVRCVDGVIFKATHGENKQFYTMVIALAGHEIDAIETIYLNDKPVTLDGNNVTSAPWAVGKVITTTEDITVTSGNGLLELAHTPIEGSISVVAVAPGEGGDMLLPFSYDDGDNEVTVDDDVTNFTGTAKVTYQYAGGDMMVQIEQFLGTSGQDVGAWLDAQGVEGIESTDRFAGIACLGVTMQYSQDAFPTGVPNFSAVIRGAKCYDPRTATTVWTENPAIIARDWALYSHGGALSSGDLVAARFTDAANACDVETEFETTEGTVELPLYTCGIAIPLDETSPEEALNDICESMAGAWGWAGGKLSLRAGVWRNPVADLTEAWVTKQDSIKIVPQPGMDDVINIMRPTFYDAAGDYVPQPAPEIRSATYIAADGEELPREPKLRGTTRAVHAQHICGVRMRESRDGVIFTVSCNMRAWRIELFDILEVTLPVFGWTDKPFECIAWAFSAEDLVTLTLRETVAAIYDPDTEFDVLDLAENTNLPDQWTVVAPVDVAVTSAASAVNDGVITTNTDITWDQSDNEYVLQSGHVEVQYTEAMADLPPGDWPQLTLAGNSIGTRIQGLTSGKAYFFRVRFVSTLNVRSAWSVQQTHVIALPPNEAIQTTQGFNPSAAFSTGS